MPHKFYKSKGKNMIMQTKNWAVLLVLLSTVLISAVEVLWKFGVSKLSLNVTSFLTNYQIITGFVLYGIVAVLFVISLKGGELTVLYPLLAISYVWVSLVSPLFFPSDKLTTIKLLGVIITIIGVYFIARGMHHKVEVI